MVKILIQDISKWGSFIKEFNVLFFGLTRWKNEEEENRKDVWNRKILGIYIFKTLLEFVNEDHSTIFKGIEIMSFLKNIGFLGCGAKGYILRIKY